MSATDNMAMLRADSSKLHISLTKAETGAAAMDEQSVSLNSSTQHCGGHPTTKGQRSNVIRCGWLRKQGGFVKTWHSRWFVLRGELLYYYKDEEETKPLALGAMLEFMAS